MKFAEQWLRSLCDPALDSAALAHALTMGGLEVEAVEPVAPEFSGVVVAEILSVAPHPDADRLRVCAVSAGAEPLQIVCGAPNAAAGLKVPLARVGARLPSMEIKAAKVRGVESRGMLCSEVELGLSAEGAGLMVLPADAEPGTELRAYLRLDDRIFTIKPTPNRGDCLSLNGLARETAALTGAVQAPLSIAPVAGVLTDPPPAVRVEAVEACPLYCARAVRGVNAGAATPAWMAQRLARCGLRSISAIVDITNYVMLELGQPLHAFDLARIQDGITVRMARAGEKLVLLNGEEATLGAGHLLIADGRGPLALAGIMGGRDSGVGDATQDVLLESAYFTPAAVAGRARALGFASDASYRFERGIDPALTRDALERATQLLLEICGGRAGAVTAVGKGPAARSPVRLRPARAQRLLGIALDDSEIQNGLRRLGFQPARGNDGFEAVPPSWRHDIAIEEDLVEELARLYGYDRIPARLPLAASALLPVEGGRVGLRALRARLVDRDYQEVVSYSFVSAEAERDFSGNADPVRLVNPIAAHMDVMRSSLLPGLMGVLKTNLDNLGAQERVRLFESGRCFLSGSGGETEALQPSRIAALAYGTVWAEQWGGKAAAVDFYDVKADLEALVYPRQVRCEAGTHPALHPGRSARVMLGDAVAGWIGEVHPALLQKYGIPGVPVAFEIDLQTASAQPTPRYQDFSRLPAVRRDISVELPEKLSLQTILDGLQGKLPEIVTKVVPFDIYRGKGIDSDKKSVAFKIILQDTEKTLTEAEIEAARQRTLEVLQEQFGATLRK